MSAVALLQTKPQPTDEEIKQALEGNLCRCTGYINIVESIRWAAEQIKCPRQKAPPEATAWSRQACN